MIHTNDSGMLGKTVQTEVGRKFNQCAYLDMYVNDSL